MNQRIRLKIGENEIELEGEDKFIEIHLKNLLENLVSGKKTIQPLSSGVKSKDISQTSSNIKQITQTEYYRAKAPKGGIETLIVLAKYLEDYNSLSEFSMKDISDLARRGKIKPPASVYYTRAVKQGLLNKIKARTYALTLTGEDAVIGLSSK